MGKMKIKEIIKVTGGKLLSGDSDIDIDPAKISTDSRAIKRGGLFIALKGPNFDGNNFVNEAFKKGAIGAIITSYELRVTSYGKVVIKVKDGTKALQAIAAYHRSLFKVPVIAVTGSNGKTTVKDMISAVLGMEYNVLKNEGTKNNHIGVPQTLLGLNKKHRIAILELGANHAGEIDKLAGIVKPDACVIINIGPSHLEFFGSLNGVFNAKREILDHLKRSGFAFLNGDDEYLSKIRSAKFRIRRFGLGERNDYRAVDISSGRRGISFTVNGREYYKLNLLGIHNVYNATGAIAVAKEFGIGYGSIKAALGAFRPTYMRLNLRKIKGLDIINDSYNSNPFSMQAALDVIRYYPAPSRWIVSGDMLELGAKAVDFHREIGQAIARSGAAGLLTFGRLSKYTLSAASACGMVKNRLWHCATHGDIADVLKKVAKKGDVILLKGSRDMAMEKVLELF
jgi:UDP-N-acetylmuramoyl-tripeptide--D-alanyl-D-alanine ligase